MPLEDAYAALEEQIKLAMFELQREIDLRDRIIREYADHVGPEGITVPIIPTAMDSIQAWLLARQPETILDALKAIAALAPEREDSAGVRLDKHLRATGLAREVLTTIGTLPERPGV